MITNISNNLVVEILGIIFLVNELFMIGVNYQQMSSIAAC